MNNKVVPMTSVLPEHQGDGGHNDLASKYDFCMVLNGGDNHGLDEYGYKAITTLTRAGLDLFIFRASEKPADRKKKKKGPGEVFVLMKAPIEVLRIFSDKVDFPLLLDPSELEKACKAGDKNANIAGFDIRHAPLESSLTPYEFIHGTYKYMNGGVREELYWRPPGDSHPFRESVRLKLTKLLIEERPENADDMSIKILNDIEDDKIITFFPLQNLLLEKKLSSDMLIWNRLPWNEPIESVREYFGEKIALYFTFMSYLNSWLVFPAVIGAGAQVIVFATGNYSHPILPPFAAAILIWGICMLEYWKRKEKFTALHWGMINFESNQADRAEFVGEKEISYINGQESIYFPTRHVQSRMQRHSVIILFTIMIVIAAVTAIYVAKYLVIFDQTAASLVNTVQIQIFNILYGMLADALTEHENHRTVTAFEDSLISKLFLFQFVNSFASFFYLAFIAEYLGACAGKHCMEALAQNLGIVFGTRIFASNITGLLIPYLKYRYNIYSKGLTLETYKRLPRPEQEELRGDYSPIKDSIADNAEVVIQFGYMMLFVTALPMAATASAIFGLLQYKSDAYKLLFVFERPVPMGCEDIGTWQSIYFLILIGAVVCNSAIVVFTMVVLEGYGAYQKMWIFIGIVLACYLIMYFLMESIPDTPKEVDIQLQRQEFIVSKVIEKVSDDTEVVQQRLPEVPILFREYLDNPTIFDT